MATNEVKRIPTTANRADGLAPEAHGATPTSFTYYINPLIRLWE